VIDGIRITFETPHRIDYYRSQWSYDSPDKRDGRSARLAMEAIDRRILIPLSYVFQTYLIFNVDPVSRLDLVNSRPPIRPPKAGDDWRRWIEPGRRHETEASISAIGIEQIIGAHDVTKDIQVCARWERAYAGSILTPPYENEWQSSLELCNPLTITIHD